MTLSAGSKTIQSGATDTFQFVADKAGLLPILLLSWQPQSHGHGWNFNCSVKILSSLRAKAKAISAF